LIGSPYASAVLIKEAGFEVDLVLFELIFRQMRPYDLYCAQTCGWSGGERRGACSSLGFDDAGDDGKDKAMRAAIARAYGADRGGGGGESGVREGGEGGSEGEGGGGWLSSPYSRSQVSFLYFHPTYHPAGGVQVLEKAWI
jgi:hypothetical protein